MANKTKGTGKGGPVRPGSASCGGVHKDRALTAVEKATTLDPQRATPNLRTTGSAGSGTERGPITTNTTGDLVELIDNLQPRLRELQSAIAGCAQSGEGGSAHRADVPNDAGGIIAIIRNLEREIETAHQREKSLEEELAETNRKLTEQESVRAELEDRIKVLQAKANLAEQLQEEYALLEEEQDQTAHGLREATSQVQTLSEERDRLVEQRNDDRRRVGELESSIADLESQVSRLGETGAALGRLRQEVSDTTTALDKAREESQELKEVVQTLKGKLDATDFAKNTLELERATARELNCKLSEQIGKLTEDLAAVRAELADLRAELARQEAENGNLVQSNERAEHEVKTLRMRIESVQKELDTSRETLREIRTATMRTTSRIAKHGSQS